MADIKFSDQEIENAIVIPQLEKVGEACVEEIDPKWLALQTQARLFIEGVNELLVSDQADFLTAWNSFLKLKHSQTKLTLYKNVYRKALNFGDILKEFYDEFPTTVLFVYESKNGYETYQLSIEEVLNRLDKFMQIQNLTKDIRNNKTTFEKMIDAQLNDGSEHTDIAQKAAIGTRNRLQRWQEKYHQTSIYGGILMWKTKSQWQMAKITNAGDIKEAYVAALMADHKEKCLCNINAGEAQYYSHELIQAFHERFLSHISNQGALLEEDIKTNSAQYAIKSLKARLPGLEQYYQAAVGIINSKTRLNREIIEGFTTTKGGERNKLIENGKLFTDDMANDYIQETLRESWKKKINKKLASKGLISFELDIDTIDFTDEKQVNNLKTAYKALS